MYSDYAAFCILLAQNEESLQMYWDVSVFLRTVSSLQWVKNLIYMIIVINIIWYLATMYNCINCISLKKRPLKKWIIKDLVIAICSRKLSEYCWRKLKTVLLKTFSKHNPLQKFRCSSTDCKQNSVKRAAVRVSWTLRITLIREKASSGP